MKSLGGLGSLQKKSRVNRNQGVTLDYVDPADFAFHTRGVQGISGPQGDQGISGYVPATYTSASALMSSLKG